MSKFANETVKKLDPYVPGEQPQNKELIKLNTNENPYPPSPKALKALGREERLYPDTEAYELVEAIAANYNINKNQVIVGNGSDEILAFIYMAYGEKIYYPKISYGFYSVFAQMFKKEAVEIPLGEKLEIRVEDYFNLQGTIIIANPNAPTGRCIPLKSIEEILKNNFNNLVVIDEAYIDFGGESSVKLINKYENLLIVQTFSKSRSLAGMRIGFAMGNEELIKDLKKVKFSFNPYNISSNAIAAGTEAMKDKGYFKKSCQQIIETREFFTEKIKEMGFLVVPSKANFVFIKTGQEYFYKLREKNILVRNFNTEPIKDFIRVTIGKREDMLKMLKAMEEIKCEVQK